MQEKTYKEEDFYDEEKENPFEIKNVQRVELHNYKLESKIRDGNYGKTYKITDKKSGEVYAAKILKIDFNDQFRIKLSREVINMSKLDFPSIVKFVGYSPTDFDNSFRPVIVREFLPNRKLEETLKIERNGYQIPVWNDTMRLICIYGIASSLKYLHSLNIIHRNLKPDNILLDEHLFPKLFGFGFSKSLSTEDSTQNGSGPVGTPSFIAPELYEGEYTKAADVYSFAMCVYEIISKVFPFENQNLFKIQYDVVYNRKRPSFKKDIPRVYKTLIESCWNQDPGKRPTFESIVEHLKTEKKFITKNVNEELYRSYIKYIDERDESQIHKFPLISLEPFYQEYQDMNEYSSGPGLFDPHIISDMKVTDVSKGEFFTSQKLEDKPNVFLSITSNFDMIFTQEEKKEVIIDISKLIEMKHPSISKFFAFSFWNIKKEPKPIILYECCSERYLSEIIEKGSNDSNWNSTNKLIVIYGIASSMSYLHKNDIYNPFINPTNILINDEYQPKLTNYFLQNRKVGLDNNISCYYQSPEYLHSKVISEKSEVYSFGLIVYSIIMNKIPIHENFHIEFNNNNVELDQEIPKFYQELIKKCLSKEPEERPSFSNIIHELESEKVIIDGIDEIKYREYIQKVKQETKYAIKKLDLRNFKKEGEIGSGSFGIIYKIIEKTTGKTYAAKIPKKILFQDFMHEIMILSKLNHSSIIKLHGYCLKDFNQEESQVIIMKYIENGSLEEFLDKERQGIEFEFWDETMKLINIYGIASAISYLHDNDILHLDVKPDNVLLNNFLFPILTDFGLSKSQDEIQRNRSNSQIFGTLFFMAPELFNDDDAYSEKADVYAFAILVYEIITKQVPYNGLSSCYVMYNVANNNLRPELDDTVPIAYRELIESCWNQDPEKRPSFKSIINQLKSEKFIKNVDKNLFEAYIKIINEKLNEKSDSQFPTYQLKSIYSQLKKERQQSMNCDGIVSLDKYRLVNKIEEDQFNSIYKVVNKDTNETCIASVSSIKLDVLSDKSLSNISSEIQNLLSMKYPTIQQFIGFSFHDFEGQNKPVRFLEYVGKLTLKNQLLKERMGIHESRWNKTTKLKIIYGIASGMSYLHSHNINHPELSTQNVYINDKFEPKLGEIGFYTLPQKTQLASSYTMNISKMSKMFTAPEAMMTGENTEKSDVYSFGVVLYETITCEKAFDDYSNPIVFIKNIKDLSKLLHLDRNIEDCYKNLIYSCLSNDIKKRPSFASIVSQLETEQSFITSEINQKEFHEYIQRLK